jgi:two-component system NtrC family sensor kinase
MAANHTSDGPSGLADHLAGADHVEMPHRYRILRRNLIAIMLAIALVPLLLMALINHQLYQRSLRKEILDPMQALLNKTRHSFELFLAERHSAVSFIASAYGYRELADQDKLDRIFEVMRNEFGGFVDLGLIDSSGHHVSYIGPYQLSGKEYADHEWFREVSIKGSHVSDVFMGYRRYPHFVIAVRHHSPTEKDFILRATIDTARFDALIGAMGLEPASDAFVVNRQGALQTASRLYGDVLEQVSLPLPETGGGTGVVETVDADGRELLLGYSYLESPDFILVLIKPRSEVLKSWYSVQSGILAILVVSLVVVLVVAFKVSDVMVRRIEESDRKRELTYRTVEHTNKLASIGRLAAGIAHEINNPLAVINEKAGLMRDLLERASGFELGDRFLQLTDSIRETVERCSSITHRLLGFARRMDTQIEQIDLNQAVLEVYSFLEKEAFHRDIEVRFELSDDLPRIASDRGQLQQVFLNILNNAFEAVEAGGEVVVTSREVDNDWVAVSIRDNGIGISEDNLRHIFEPFFSTRKMEGTGLGLSITYGLVDKLGGRIDVKSAPGMGSTFTVFLPIGATERTVGEA